MTDVLGAAFAYSLIASLLVAASPLVARSLDVPTRDVVHATVQAVVVFPILLAGIGAVVLLAWAAR